MRELDLTQQYLNCYDEPVFDDYNNIEFVWELWFDVQKYFGVELDDDEWINFYTAYNPNTDKITAEYVIDSSNGEKTEKWELTADEELFLRKKIEEYIGMSLKQYYTIYGG